MKLKCRVTSLLALLAVSSLFITFKLFTRLESNIGSEITKREQDVVIAEATSFQSSFQSKQDLSVITAPAVILSEAKKNNAATTVSPWEVWASWVKPTKLYPVDNFHSSSMNSILSALSSSPVTKFGIGYRGTQLKATMYLNGSQRTVFKPKRFARTDIVDGPNNPYAGYDRHNGEITAFHLDGLLGFGMAPPVSGRILNLTKLIPVTEKKLFETYIMKDGNMCFYGKCYYCKPSDLACASKDLMEGSVTIWLPGAIELQTWRHPYQRTYVQGRKAKWETDDKYCQAYLISSSKYYHLIPDIMDTVVFDYLIGNADRHHFETFASLGDHGRLLHIDSGKSFGNPNHDETSILTPLKQCCRLRNSTWMVLQSFAKDSSLSKQLDNSLKRDPLYPILTVDHLQAIDRRLQHILNAVHLCIETYGYSTVIFEIWK